MGLAAVTTFALCLWIVLWAIGTKAFDAILLTLFIVVIAAAVKILLSYLPSQRTE